MTAGDRLAAGTIIGPIAKRRRLAAMTRVIAAAVPPGMKSINGHDLTLPLGTRRLDAGFPIRI